jgi:hypothetical protein
MCTLTRTKLAPDVTAIESAASASLRSTLMPSERDGAASRTATAHAVIAATVIGGTLVAKNGASPKFSMTIASKPAASRARAHAAADLAHSAAESDARGLPGSGGRWMTPARTVRRARLVVT